MSVTRAQPELDILFSPFNRFLIDIRLHKFITGFHQLNFIICCCRLWNDGGGRHMHHTRAAPQLTRASEERIRGDDRSDV